ncbi:phage tail tape measure protein [Asaia siamensis]
MSEALRTEFRLDLADGLSGPIDRIIAVVERLERSFSGLATTDPFDDLWKPIERTTTATSGLNESIERTQSVMNEAGRSTRGFGEALGSAATEAASATREMNNVAESAERSAGRIQKALSHVSGGSAREGGSGPGGRLWSAAGHFNESVHAGVGSAFGAAALGFGLIEPVHAAADYQNSLTHIGLTLGIHGDENASFSDAYGRQIDAWARQYGQRSSDLVEAATFLNQEGYSQNRMNALVPVIAQISTAYNAHPDSVSRTAFALNQNLGVATGDTNLGLAMLARVGKLSALPFEQLAPLFPELASSAAGVGVHGLDQVADLGGMLALIRKNTGTSGEATTALRAFIQTITSPHARHRFDKYGVDLTGTILNAQHENRDPLSAVLDTVRAIKNPDARFKAIGDLFGNERDQLFVRSMDRDWSQYTTMRNDIRHTSPGMISDDFSTARRSSDLTALTSFEDVLTQLERRVGHGFVPVLKIATVGLGEFINVWDRFDKLFPRATPIILTTVGGILALVTAATALAAISGPVAAGIGLLVAGIGLVVSPIGIAVASVAALGAGLYLLLTHMDQVGNGIMRFIEGFGHLAAAIGHVTAAIPNFLWKGVTGENTPAPKHFAPLRPVNSQTPLPVLVRIEHPESMKVSAQPHPTIKMETVPVKGTGRMMDRP